MRAAQGQRTFINFTFEFTFEQKRETVALDNCETGNG